MSMTLTMAWRAEVLGSLNKWNSSADIMYRGGLALQCCSGCSRCYRGRRLSSACGKYDHRSRRRYSNLISAVDENVNVGPIISPLMNATKPAKGVMRS